MMSILVNSLDYGVTDILHELQILKSSISLIICTATRVPWLSCTGEPRIASFRNIWFWIISAHLKMNNQRKSDWGDNSVGKLLAV